MNFIIFALQSLFAVFCGLFLGSFFVFLFQLLFKKKFLSVRVTSAAVFLSLIVATSAAILLATKDADLIYRNFFDNSGFLIILAVFFILISVFWKYLLPLSAAFYVVALIFTVRIINQNTVPLNSSFELNSQSKNIQSIKIVQLPQKLILPVPHELILKSEYSEDKQNFINKWLFKNQKEVKVKLPDSEIGPVLYTVKIRKNNEEYTAEIKQSL